MYRLSPRHFTSLVPGIVVVGILCTAPSLIAQTPAAKQTPADNTKVNTRDRAEGAVTADQQKENATDRDLTQKIRRSLMDDKALSTYAKNVKIVSMNGQVTLKGPVRSDQEKQAIEAKAVEVAGAGKVMNEMSVAPAKPVK